MSGPLYRLVYASRVAPECLAELKVVMPRLLANAMARNRVLGITSLLCVHRGWFVQALEGPDAAVVRMFEILGDDRRHRDLFPIVEGRASDRLFGCWSLAGRALGAADLAVVSALGPGASFDPTALPATTILRLLTTVGEVHARALSQQQALEGALR